MSQSHWVDPERMFEKVVVLTADAIYVSNPNEERAREIGAALDEGQLASGAVKDDPTIIPIAVIRKVSYDRNDDAIDVGYTSEPKSEKRSQNISFSSVEERDDFAAQLAELLPGFESNTVAWGRIRASLGPLSFGTLVSFLTWLFHDVGETLAGGEEVEIPGRRSGIKRLVVWSLEIIGPIGVMLTGGVILALTAVLLVHRMKRPPIMTTLTPAK